jgi:error-prone DNA polymerase
VRNIPRHIGTHPGGVVITPRPIWEYTHIEVSPLGLPVIAWEKDAAEDAGLVKIDLLGNRSLAVLRDTLKLVNKKRRTAIEWEGFQPNTDGRTRNYIESGETMGIFYIESPATRQLLHKMRRADFPHLVVASSIIRPAANRYINEYVARLHGKSYRGLMPEIDEALAETHGIMVYQEDVSRVAIAAAGFSAAEADGLRKVLSRKDRDRRLSAYRERFYSGCRRKQVAPAVIGELWNMILSFDGYSFCKSHSASYAMLSYKLAYLKCRYPLEFLCSVINNGGGFYSRQVYLNMVRRLGFDIRGPDVNKSSSAYTVENASLRIGLSQIRELSAPFLQKILDARSEGGPFSDLKDFNARTAPSYSQIRMLVRSGSLDSIAGGLSRPQMFWYYMQLGRGREEELIPSVPQAPSCIGDYRDITKIHDELKTLDLIISRHALEVFQPRIDAYTAADGKYPCIDSGSIRHYKGRMVRIPGIMVTGKEVLTKNRDAMCFVSFEDPKGVFETVVFPGRYRDFEPLLDFGRAFIVSGMVCEDAGAYSIRVEELFPLNRRNSK